MSIGWLWWAAAASGWVAAVGALLIVAARSSRREMAHALRLHSLVQPCLLRRAQELGLDDLGGAPVADARLDDVVDNLCCLAERLIDRDRKQLSDADHIAVARTMPIDRPPFTE
jgi:hypothetical protein